ncbi:aldolase/citrate lyase family protein [Breoghania sp.]|uniref:HpcH/HpaI aldolase family protein n=1 Tax=Breoghania sp. TaxID=2065378 RepID=UPI002AA91E0F|nr:aldolase/citrate lyase family protein [Breoghania sp.]
MIEPAMTLANRLRAGETIVTAWSTLSGSVMPEVLVRAGYQAVTLDMQHGMHDFASVVDGIAAVVHAGGHPVARVPVGDYATASRLLDAGAQAIIAPMIGSVEDAAAFVAQIKYPPAGTRSWGPGRAMELQGVAEGQAYLMSADAETLGLGMIETRAALEAVDDIVAVDGLDGAFVGPADLSIALSDGARCEPSGEEVQEAAGQIAAAAIRAGKIAGIYCNNLKDARRARDMGFTFISWANDQTIIQTGVSALLDPFNQG